MLKIAFCDDDREQLFLMQTYAEQYSITHSTELSCTLYDSPFELLAAMEQGERFDVLFLDVLMPGENGMDAAAEIRSLDAEIRRCRAELANDRYLSDRAKKMYGAEAVSQAYAEERLRAREASEAKVDAVRHKTDALKYRCRQTEAQIAALQHRLELSVILLELTVVRAMADGWVTNLTLTPGGCYKPGDVLCGFIASGSWRVQANFKESELSEIAEGMSAKIWLRQYPGKLYRGVVESTGWGAERRTMSRETGLPAVRRENEWFLLPQRFPVQIRILNPDQGCQLHHGASAYVEIDTPARPVRQFFGELFLWH